MEYGVVFAKLRERALKGEDPSLSYFGWSAPFEKPSDVPPGAAEDPAVWALANPALGIRINMEHVAKEQRSMDPRGFAVERLGVGDWPRVSEEDGSVISVKAWLGLRDPRSRPVDRGSRWPHGRDRDPPGPSSPGGVLGGAVRSVGGRPVGRWARGGGCSGGLGAVVVTSLLRRLTSPASEQRFTLNDLLQQMSYAGSGYQFIQGGTPDGGAEPIENSFEGYVNGAYKSNGVIFACMAARMLLFSEARFQFRRMVNGRPGDLFGSAALAGLEAPWPGGTTGDLLSKAITDVDLAGNFFLTRRPAGLDEAPPGLGDDRVRVQDGA
jgi:hypothetical protein